MSTPGHGQGEGPVGYKFPPWRGRRRQWEGPEWSAAERSPPGGYLHSSFKYQTQAQQKRATSSHLDFLVTLFHFEGLGLYYSLRGVPLKLPELAFGSEDLSPFRQFRAHFCLFRARLSLSQSVPPFRSRLSLSWSVPARFCSFRSRLSPSQSVTAHFCFFRARFWPSLFAPARFCSFRSRQEPCRGSVALWGVRSR